MTVAVITFVAALAIIGTEKLNRTKVALLGALVVVVSQTIDQEQAIEAIDFNTIGLLAGMMLIVKLTETTGRLHVPRDPGRPARQGAAAGHRPGRWPRPPRCSARSWTTSRRSC